MIKFIDLAAQQDRIKKTIDGNIAKVLSHGQYINGPEVRELEDRLAQYTGVSFAIGCSSGTDALLMTLMAYDVTQGDAVFTPAFSFIAAAEVIQLLGATTVFVDIEPDTFNISVSNLENEIENTLQDGKLIPRGIIPVNIFGQPADYEEINRLAKKYDLFVLEDAAQSFGSVYKDRISCSLSDVAATSFYPAKPLGCYGDGGMIFTDNEELSDKLVLIRDHGEGDKYRNVRIGVNGRLDTLQAAILLAKFDIFEEEVQLRQKIAERYTDLLEDALITPYIKDYNTSSWSQYSVMHSDRDGIIKKLKLDNIPTAIHYPVPIHLQEVFSLLGYRKGDFPVSESVSQKIFSLPMHPYLTKKDQDRIINTIGQILTSKKI